MEKIDETKEAEGNEKKESAEDTGTGDKSKASTLVDDANAAAERMEKANERKAELLRQEEELAAKRALGGTTEAGQEPVKKEVSDVDYAKKAISGELDLEKGE